MAKEFDDEDKKLNEYEKMVEGVFEDAKKLSKIILKNADDIKNYIQDNNLKYKTEKVLNKLRLLNYKGKLRYFRDALGLSKKKRDRKQNERQENLLDDTSNTIFEPRNSGTNENQGTIPLITEQEGENEDIENAPPETNEDDPENILVINGKEYNITKLTDKDLEEIQNQKQENTGGELSTTKRVNEPPQITIPSDPPEVRNKPRIEQPIEQSIEQSIELSIEQSIEQPIEQRTEFRSISNTNSSFGPNDYRRFEANSEDIQTYRRPQLRIPLHLGQQRQTSQRQIQQQQQNSQQQNQEEPMSETGSEIMRFKIPTDEEFEEIQLEKERHLIEERIRLENERIRLERIQAQIQFTNNQTRVFTADANYQVQFLPPLLSTLPPMSTLPSMTPLPSISTLGNLPRTNTYQAPQSLYNQSLYNQTRYNQSRYNQVRLPPPIVPYENEKLKRSKRTNTPAKRVPHQPIEIIDLTDIPDIEEPLERVNIPERRENIIPRREIKEEEKEGILEEIDLSADE